MKNYLFSSLLFSSLIFFCCNKELVINKPSTSIGKLPSPGELAALFNQQGLILNVSQSDFKLSARSESTGFCEPEPPGGQNCNTYHVNTTIDVPPTYGCPGCDDATVNFDVMICQTGTPPVTTVTFFNFLVNSCPDLEYCWSLLPNYQLGPATDAFTYAASVAMENQFVSGLLISGFIVANCPDRYVSSTFIRQTCYQICEIPLLNFPYYTYLSMPCGVKCCKRMTGYCKEEDGSISISSSTFSQVGSSSCVNRAWSECNGTIIDCYDAPCGEQ